MKSNLKNKKESPKNLSLLCIASLSSELCWKVSNLSKTSKLTNFLQVTWAILWNNGAVNKKKQHNLKLKYVKDPVEGVRITYILRCQTDSLNQTGLAKRIKVKSQSLSEQPGSSPNNFCKICCKEMAENNICLPPHVKKTTYSNLHSILNILFWRMRVLLILSQYGLKRFTIKSTCPTTFHCIPDIWPLQINKLRSSTLKGCSTLNSLASLPILMSSK